MADSNILSFSESESITGSKEGTCEIYIESDGIKSNSSNFNTYDNPEQQQTSAAYVLNTNTQKFHYPSCKSVKNCSAKLCHLIQFTEDSLCMNRVVDKLKSIEKSYFFNQYVKIFTQKVLIFYRRGHNIEM